MSREVKDSPEDVSSFGVRGMLKSPPTISCPSAYCVSCSRLRFKNASWWVFGV